jgi:pimeloyl-ACP methyl ester carboxylesterase
MKRYLLVAVAAVFLSGCSAPSYQGKIEHSRRRGSVERVEHLSGYSRLYLAAMLWWAKLPEPIKVQDGVELYRVSYWTEYRGQPTLASGLLSIPRSGSLRGVVSYQHGTNPTRADAPSAPTLGEGVLGSATFAGGRYLFLAPDYPGLGVSTITQPYLYAPTTVNSVVDLLQAARNVTQGLGRQWNPSIYLVGFSQGGHATASVQRALESLHDPALDVRANAAVAGAYDLERISVPFALRGASTAHSLYLALLARAYAEIYGQPLTTLVKGQYAGAIPRLFDGTHTVEEILAALPRAPRDMFTTEFFTNNPDGPDQWFRKALAENEAYNWAPKAPLRMYYGDRDKDVPPDDAKFAAKYMAERGGNVKLVPVGPYEHTESMYHALPKIRLWFDAASNGTLGARVQH